MAASFPGAVVTEPTSEIASFQTIKVSHIDQLYLEVIAIEQATLGTLGVNRSFIPASNAGVPLTLRGVSSQSGDLLDVGSSLSSTDRLVLTAAGQLKLPVTGSSGGIVLGTTTSITNPSSGSLLIKPTSDSTLALSVQDSTANYVLQVDSTNHRIGVAAIAAGPSTALHISPGNTVSGSLSGIQFGTDSQANLYRSAAASLATDGQLLVVSPFSIKSGAVTLTLSTVASGGSTTTGYTGNDLLVAAARYLEVTNGSGLTGVVLRRPDGTRRRITIDNEDQISVTAVP